MYRDEYEVIWETQQKHYPDILTDELKQRLYKAIFHQRRLKSQDDLIGICALEDGAYLRIEKGGELVPTKPQKRTPACTIRFQRFRALQRINDMRVVEKKTGEVRKLTDVERGQLLMEAENRKSLSSKEIPEVLKWGKQYVAQLNFDDETGSALSGCWSNQQLKEIFGERWDRLSLDEKDSIVLDLFEAEPDDWYEDDPDDHREGRKRTPHIARRALACEGPWGLIKPTKGEALQLVEFKASSDYAGLSKAALSRLMPLMESGMAYRTAVEKCYRAKLSEILDYLPPVNKVFKSVNNPIVTRSLTELRRVMSHLIKFYGRPEQIRLEVARDIQKGKAGREAAREGMKANLKRKKEAGTDYFQEIGRPGATLDGASKRDVEKVRLWYEQDHVCPYTSKSIPAGRVLTSEYEVDHIIPFSISQDDSFTNKVLVHNRANQEKGNRIPIAAFGEDQERWKSIEAWVAQRRKKHGKVSSRKLDRILITKDQTKELLDDFRSRQLNDTRWASLWARKYLMHLYGGNVVEGVDEKGRRRILTSAGSVTADLRREKGMDAMLKAVLDPSTPLPPGPFSKRFDHRHHIVDAFAVAWCGPQAQALMSRAAEAAPSEKRRLYGKIEDPWDGYQADIIEALSVCVPSHRVSNRARGALHKETVYSPTTVTSGERRSNLVVGSRHRQRNMDHDGNHHVLLAMQDGNDGLVQTVSVVTYWEAVRRLNEARQESKTGDVVYRRVPGTLMTLCIGDTLSCEREGRRQYCWVRQIWQAGQVQLCPVSETRTPDSPPKDKAKMEAFLKKKIPRSGLLISLNVLGRMNSRKHSVSPIGVVRPARA
jgi:CRISPR-associated endonuclease Csn1